MPSFAEIRAKTDALQEQVKKLTEEAAADIKPLLQQFLVDHPQVIQVKWAQYTPYFNDGDECVFSLHDVYFHFEGQDPDDVEGATEWELGYVKDGVYPYWPDGVTGATAAACKELSDSLSALESPLKVLFGDHVEVIVTKEGVEVEEYSHD